MISRYHFSRKSPSLNLEADICEKADLMGSSLLIQFLGHLSSDQFIIILSLLISLEAILHWVSKET